VSRQQRQQHNEHGEVPDYMVSIGERSVKECGGLYSVYDEHRKPVEDFQEVCLYSPKILYRKPERKRTCSKIEEVGIQKTRLKNILNPKIKLQETNDYGSVSTLDVTKEHGISAKKPRKESPSLINVEKSPKTTDVPDHLSRALNGLMNKEEASGLSSLFVAQSGASKNKVLPTTSKFLAYIRACAML